MSATQSRSTFAYALALLPGIIAVVCFWFIYLPWSERGHATHSAEQLAASKARQLDNALEQLAYQVDGLARAPALRAAMRADQDQQSETLVALARDYSLLFDQLDRLVLIPLTELGIADLGAYEQTLRGNIETDLLRRVANLEDIIADTYLVDGERVIGLARPVFAGNRSIGALLLTLKIGWLENVLYADIQDSNAHYRVALVYKLPYGDAQEISSNRASPFDTAVVSEAASEANPSLLVQVAALPMGAGNSASTAMLAGLGLLVLLPPLALWAARRASAQLLDDDLATLVQLLDGTNGGAKSVAFNHRGVADLADSVVQKLARQPAAVEPSVDAVNAEPNVEVSAPVDEWSNRGLPTDMLVEDLDADQAARVDQPDLPAHIFRAYDIRGHAENELSDPLCRSIGQAVGSQALDAGCDRLVVGRDGRHSSERIRTALIEGLLSTGCDVVDIGLVATPVLYFAAHELGTQAGVMITGSHNDAEDNGFKVMLDGQCLAEDDVAALAERIRQTNFHRGDGLLSQQDMIDSYIDRIAEDVVVAAPLKVVLDCANGAASDIAPALFASLGCETVPLFAEIDGDFPNHSPDPTVPENLRALVDEVQSGGADLGIAFDGDADRMVAVTGGGQIVDADQLLMLFGRDVVTRNPGADVVYDIKCSKHLSQVIADQGGRPVMWKSGHSLIKQKMREIGALVGGEFTGHFCFMERWYGFDDGLYSAARLVELLTLDGKTLQEAVDELPQSASSPEISVAVAESDKFQLVESLRQSTHFTGGKATHIDGLRIDYPDGWGLVRASNTSARLSLRFEADDELALEKIQDLFRQALADVDPALANGW